MSITKRYLTSFFTSLSKAMLILSGVMISMSHKMLNFAHIFNISCVSSMLPITLPFTVLLPEMRGKQRKSIGLSGAPTSTRVPFTLSSSKYGPRECFAETVSNMKSILLFLACIWSASVLRMKSSAPKRSLASFSLDGDVLMTVTW
nr:hypothetical protein Iba_chr06aCG6730 [Ipomoea batatas]